ncbi:unnamed protein product [Moneuplotes crassus]|uniref:Uncharacterized protein n=1 Tax=Euplotes crassus TaxID=5936 RepID=A0AAD1U3R0_EUPCR|nr:unnamed protein product [Moneuplotes crassus]
MTFYKIERRNYISSPCHTPVLAQSRRRRMVSTSPLENSTSVKQERVCFSGFNSPISINNMKEYRLNLIPNIKCAPFGRKQLKKETILNKIKRIKLQNPSKMSNRVFNRGRTVERKLNGKGGTKLNKFLKRKLRFLSPFPQTSRNLLNQNSKESTTKKLNSTIKNPQITASRAKRVEIFSSRKIPVTEDTRYSKAVSNICAPLKIPLKTLTSPCVSSGQQSQIKSYTLFCSPSQKNSGNPKNTLMDYLNDMSDEDLPECMGGKEKGPKRVSFSAIFGG